MDEREKNIRRDIEREGRRTQAEIEAERDLRRSRATEGEGYIERESRKSPEEIERDLHQTRAEIEETIEAIERRFSPGEMIDQAIHTLGGGPREYAVNLGQAIKTNPVPATLVAIGLAWLMASSGRQTQVYPMETAFPAETAGREKGAMFKEKYGQARERAGSFAETAAGRVRQGLGRLSQTFSGGRQAVSEQYGEARERAGGMAGYAGEEYGQARERAAEMAERARLTGRRGQDVLEEQPLILVALGLAVGAALGASLPVSESEKRMAGEYGEGLLEQAKEVGREQLEKGERVMAKAGEAAREEAEKQGVASRGEKIREPETVI
jgi:hypothetical protein